MEAALRYELANNLRTARKLGMTVRFGIGHIHIEKGITNAIYGWSRDLVRWIALT